MVYFMIDLRVKVTLESMGTFDHRQEDDPLNVEDKSRTYKKKAE